LNGYFDPSWAPYCAMVYRRSIHWSMSGESSVYTILLCSHVPLGIMRSALTAPSTLSMSCTFVSIPSARKFCHTRGSRHSRAVMTGSASLPKSAAIPLALFSSLLETCLGRLEKTSLRSWNPKASIFRFQQTAAAIDIAQVGKGLPGRYLPFLADSLPCNPGH
jgi:hypothetical protein